MFLPYYKTFIIWLSTHVEGFEGFQKKRLPQSYIIEFSLISENNLKFGPSFKNNSIYTFRRLFSSFPSGS